MRGLELQQARANRRAELRRSASREGYTRGDFLALDPEELIQRADLADVGAQGNAVKRRMLLTPAAWPGVAQGAIAAAWKIDGQDLARLLKTPLVDTTGIAKAIDAQVLEELPETPEPHRMQEPPASIDARNDRRWARVD